MNLFFSEIEKKNIIILLVKVVEMAPTTRKDRELIRQILKRIPGNKFKLVHIRSIKSVLDQVMQNMETLPEDKQKEMAYFNTICLHTLSKINNKLDYLGKLN